MFIILPHDIDGISKLENKLAGVDLSKILTHLPEEEVVVSIPKFKLEETTDLNDILTEVCINGCMTSLNPLHYGRMHTVLGIIILCFVMQPA